MDMDAVIRTETAQDPGVVARPDDSYLDTRLPFGLRGVVTRHHEHLTALVASLRTAGIGEAVIQQSIDVLIDRYREELTNTVSELARNGFDD